MFLLGATAIEDKLQEGVPDAIHTMQMAGIKVGRARVAVGMVLCMVLIRRVCRVAGLGAYRRPARDGNQHRSLV